MKPPLAALLLLLAALAPDHQGGTLRLAATSPAGTIDPHINYESQFWQIFFFTQDQLVTFRKAEGAAGLELVPDLADAVPQPQDSGTTYIFHLRPGIKFSTGRPVTVRDVAASYRRMFKVSGPNTGSWYGSIVGADACLKAPATCTLRGGIVPDEAAGTITIHLARPSAEFLYQIAMPMASILPEDTPARDLGTVPPAATGPYMIESYNPQRGMHLVRNPYFSEWSHEAQPAGYVNDMVYRYGLSNESELTAVINGDQDWMYDEKPQDRLAEIGARHADLAHIHPMLAYYYLFMNTREKPFDDARARRAVAFAVNRRAAITLHGGPALGAPLCQLLPKGLPGYAPYCPYTRNPGTVWSAPDLDRARALVEQAGAKGSKITLVSSDNQVERTIGITIQSMLRDIGFDASVHAISHNIRDTYMENSSNHVQIGLTDWYQDYPAPSDFLAVLFSCKSFHPGSDASINMAEFCDPGIEAALDQAASLGATDPSSANALWAELDRQLTDLAPATTLFQINELDIVSKRLGNFRFSPLFHLMLSQVWVL